MTHRMYVAFDVADLPPDQRHKFSLIEQLLTVIGVSSLSTMNNVTFNKAIEECIGLSLIESGIEGNIVADSVSLSPLGTFVDFKDEEDAMLFKLKRP